MQKFKNFKLFVIKIATKRLLFRSFLWLFLTIGLYISLFYFNKIDAIFYESPPKKNTEVKESNITNTISNNSYLNLEELMKNVSVASFISPSGEHSVNLWFIFDPAKNKNISSGNITSNITQTVQHQFSLLDEKKIFFDIEYIHGPGSWGGYNAVDGFVRWNSNDSFILLKNNTFIVAYLRDNGGVEEFNAPDSTYELIDIDKNLTSLLMYKDSDSSFYVYHIIDSKLVKIGANPSSPIRKYDFINDGFVFYPSNINTETDAISNDLLIYNPTSRKQDIYKILLDPTKTEVGRGCGGWHLASKIKGVVRILDQCEGRLDTKASYYNKGYIEIMILE